MCGTTLLNSRKRTGFARAKGLKAVGFAKWDGSDLVVNTATGVIALPTTMTDVFRFELKNTADVITETATKDMNTMTAMKVGAVTIALRYCNRLNNIKDVQALLDGVWVLFAEHNDGTIAVYGSENGVDVVTAVESSEEQGFVLTLASNEKDSAYQLAAAGVAEYELLIAAYA